MLAVIENFIKYRTFLVSVVARDIKRKYYKSVLGMAWSVINPVMHVVVLTIVFKYIFGRNTPNFSLYLSIGHTIFYFTSGGINISMHSIAKNSGIINKIYIPKYMFVISDLAVDLINTLFSFIPIIFLVIYYRVSFTIYWLLIPVVFIMQIIFTLGLCLIMSSYGLFYRDLTHLYGIFVTLWMYLTPIFYTMDRIDPKYQFLWKLNPLVHFLQIFRDIIYSASAPSLENFVIAGIYALLTFCLGCAIFNECQNRFFLYM